VLVLESLFQQLSQVNLFAIAATAAKWSGLPGGVLLDRIGPSASSLITGLLVASAFALMAEADRQDEAPFAVGFALLGIGGSLGFLVSVQTAFLLPLSALPVFMTAANCLFDASTSIGLMMHLIAKEVDLTPLFRGYAVFAGLFFAAYVGLWLYHRADFQAMQQLEQAAEAAPAVAEEGRAAAVSDLTLRFPDLHGAADRLSISLATDDLTRRSTFVRRTTVAAAPAPSPAKAGGLAMRQLDVKQQLRTPLFAMLSVFAAVMLFRAAAFFATQKEVLEALGDRQHNHLYTTILSVFLPLSILYFPVIPRMLTRFGFVASFHVVAALGVGYSVCSMIPALEVQVLTAALFSAFRAFFFGTFFTFVAHNFGSRSLGTLVGLIDSCAGVATLSLIPIMDAINSHQEGDLFYLNLTLTLFVLPCVFLVQRILPPYLQANPGADIKGGD
jgi:hypothetical protein